MLLISYHVSFINDYLSYSPQDTHRQALPCLSAFFLVVQEKWHCHFGHVNRYLITYLLISLCPINNNYLQNEVDQWLHCFANVMQMLRVNSIRMTIHIIISQGMLRTVIIIVVTTKYCTAIKHKLPRWFTETVHQCSTVNRYTSLSNIYCTWSAASQKYKQEAQLL